MVPSVLFKTIDRSDVIGGYPSDLEAGSRLRLAPLPTPIIRKNSDLFALFKGQLVLTTRYKFVQCYKELGVTLFDGLTVVQVFFGHPSWDGTIGEADHSATVEDGQLVVVECDQMRVGWDVGQWPVLKSF